ncbi:hypothetical protein GOP47_0017577 [Adiantum capillus-veneris]|uniref:Uncharacterized protein n=1 Tax=Adiantum capillus-veneris TaxID=13818 RepID=A0A9D4UGM4_ADICA|nr:hypothetical protein GOP47_0017577 [Adiantum capillus-veneris]
MARRCSHCGHNGHNSRTCLDNQVGFKLFGVRLSTECCMVSSPAGTASECSSSSLTAMRKSVSMGNLCNYGGAEGEASPLSPSQFEQHDAGEPVEGYASDDLVHTNSSSRERKKGVPWTEEEHRSFLLGLQKLGKGDWRGISRNFVKTRTPTQVASHAQKYFLRRNNLNKRRRRSSLFDITPDSVSCVLEEPELEEAGCDDPDVCAELSLGQSIPHGSNQVLEVSRLTGRAQPIRYFPVPVPHFPASCVPVRPSDVKRVVEMEAAEAVEHGGFLRRSADVDVMEVVPEVVDALEGTYNPPQLTFDVWHLPLWPEQRVHGLNKHELGGLESKIVRPIPIIPSLPKKEEQALKITELTINMTRRVMEPTPLSYKLLEEGSRHSAFHVTIPNNGSREVDAQGSLSSAISVP